MASEETAAAPPAAGIARRLLAGAGAIALAGIVGRLFWLLPQRYLTARIGTAGYGVQALVRTAAELAGVVGLLGLDMSYARLAPAAGARAGDVERLCWRVALGGSAATGLLVGAALALFADVPGGAAERAALGAIVALWAAVNSAASLASVRCRIAATYARLAASMVIGAAVAVGAIVALAALWRPDHWALLFGNSIGMVTAVAVAGVPWAALAGRAPPPGAPAAPPISPREVLAVGIAGAVTAPANWVLGSADRWFLDRSFGPRVVGVYNFSTQFGLLASIVPSAVGQSWVPEVARFADGPRDEAAAEQTGRIWEGMAAIYLVAWVAVAVSGGDIVRLVSAPAFHDGAPIVPWIAAGAVLAGFAQLGNSSLVLAKRLERALAPLLVTAAVSAAGNFALVPRFGMVGAAAVNAAAAGVLAALLLREGARLFPIRVRAARLIAVAALSLAAVVAAGLLRDERPLVDLALKLPAGIAYAAVVAAIVAPEIFGRLLRRARRAA
jgi:O-antigen/teichoic acid export membrane protein